MVTYLGRGQHIRYFCEDESRFGMKTLMSRVITVFGVKQERTCTVVTGEFLALWSSRTFKRRTLFL
jgi:hypothetical protein